MIHYKKFNAVIVALASLASPFALSDADPYEFDDRFSHERHSEEPLRNIQHHEFEPINNQQSVTPGPMQVIDISRYAVNMIRCDAGPITDRTFSEERPLLYKAGEGTNGQVGYIKLQQQRVGGETQYYTDSVELYLTCAGEIYSLLMVPSDIPSQHIVLRPGRSGAIGKNVSIFRDLDIEDAAVTLIDKVQYEDSLPGTFSVSNANPDRNDWHFIVPGVRARLMRSIKPDGVGLIVHEYIVHTVAPIHLDEFDFVGLRDNSFAVRLSKTSLESREVGRAFIVERMWR